MRDRRGTLPGAGAVRSRLRGLSTGGRSRGGQAAAAAALVFGLWHAAAVAIAPYPDSAIRRALHPVFEPYLRVGYLDHQWTFFGPRPDAGRLVRYQVLLTGGVAREFALSEAVERGSPGWFRWMRLFDRVSAGAPALTHSGAAYLCRRHANLRPRAIRFVVLHQLTPSPELYRAGVRPTDPEALSREPGEAIPCRKATAASQAE
jgi:hypothetical protein